MQLLSRNKDRSQFSVNDQNTSQPTEYYLSDIS